MIKKTCKNQGFTLAEVLITLGIIGVVAAVTMPVLNSKIQQHILINKWKKAYSDINKAYMLVQAEEDLSSYYNCSEAYCFDPVIQKIIQKYKSITKNEAIASEMVSERVITVI